MRTVINGPKRAFSAALPVQIGCFTEMSQATTVLTNDADVPQHNSMNGSFVVRGEMENQEEVKRLSLNTVYLWGLGISIVVGGQFVGWNEALKSGFGGALIATGLVSSGYYCLICCMAEISSAIPFGGKSNRDN